jgi:exonuclease SbcC
MFFENKMIPLKLYMRNFMCYREQTLDLRGIHLACLTGNNGHGKSAILDAVTWSLWGRSRVGARRDDELIYLGQQEMEVEFEFRLADATSGREDLSAGGIRYRVIRKRGKHGKRKRGQSSLDLQGWDTEANRFRSLTEPTISRTQGRIDDLLRMDYDTFINSAFLLQGRADEFTTKRPTERKRVLGDILGLGVYDRYEKLAKEAAREKKERADQLVATIEQIDHELAREPEYVAAVKAMEAELARLQSERAETEETHNRVRMELQEVELARRQLVGLERRMEERQAQADRLAQEVADHQSRLQELESALAHETEIKEGFELYQRAIAENEAMNAKLSELVSLNERHSELERLIADGRHELDVERRSMAERVRQLQETARALEQKTEWSSIQDNLASLDQSEHEKEQSRQEIQATNAQVAALAAENKRAEEDAAQLKEKIALLSAADTVQDGARCPLCGQSLAESECLSLLNAFSAQLENERAAYKQRTARIKEGQQRIATFQVTITRIDRELRGRTGWRRKEAALGYLIQEAQAAYDILPHAKETLQDIESRLERGEYALATREALREVEQQLSELGYDAEAHRRIRADMDTLRPYEAKKQVLRDARSGVKTIQLALSQLNQRRADVEKMLTADREQAKELDGIVSQMPELQRQAIAARQALEEAHDREQRASLKLGAARNKVDYCADLRQQRVRRQKEEKQFREEQAIYQELQRAFGKNGVQAMLIESAIPDIEQEANRLLAKMTRGIMQVRFGTQRNTQKGDTVETLDIHIADDLGTRSYETYSGGERYRINFAIRIALSRLLARRAGAQLQMLVIDEGFGTQDREGRDGLLDAINAVQDDFACILVITHIEELKNAFNVRIEVNKTSQGSEIVIT